MNTRLFWTIFTIIIIIIGAILIAKAIKEIKEGKGNKYTLLSGIIIDLVGIVVGILIVLYPPGIHDSNNSDIEQTSSPAESPLPTPTWSPWESKLPDYVTTDNYVIESCEGYRYRDRETITSQSADLPGWTLYDTSISWGEYGKWSGWLDTYVESTDFRQVETRTVDAVYKTEYNYSRWSQRSDGSGWNGPYKGTWNGIYCGHYNERGWSEDRLNYAWTEGSFIVYGYSGNYWYNESSRQKLVTPAKTQYRYRDREQITTYYYEKLLGEWSTWTPGDCPSTYTNNENFKVEKDITIYQYRPK